MHISQINNQAATSIVFDTPIASMTGDLKVEGSIDCAKSIVAADEVTASGIKLTKHTHSGVTSGGSSTGQPQ